MADLGINLFFVETQFRSKIDYFIKMYLHHFIKKTAAIRVTLILEKKPQQIQGKMPFVKTVYFNKNEVHCAYLHSDDSGIISIKKIVSLARSMGSMG